MDTATIIITCLTFMAVGIGLFLNHNTNLKLAGQLKDFEEKTNRSISAILDIVKAHKEENAKQLDSSTGEIKKSLIENSSQINTALAKSIETIRKTIDDNILSIKLALIETKEDIQNSNAKLQKETANTIEARLRVFQTEIQTTLENTESEFEVNSKAISTTFLNTGEEINKTFEVNSKAISTTFLNAGKEINGTFARTITELKKELDNAKKELDSVKQELDTVLEIQETRQRNTLTRMEGMFKEVINEIKRPLELD